MPNFRVQPFLGRGEHCDRIAARQPITLRYGLIRYSGLAAAHTVPRLLPGYTEGIGRVEMRSNESGGSNRFARHLAK